MRTGDRDQGPGKRWLLPRILLAVPAVILVMPIDLVLVSAFIITLGLTDAGF